MIYLISFLTSVLIAVSYLLIAALVLPRMRIRRDLMLFGVVILAIDGIRRLIGAVLIIYSFIELQPDTPATAAAWATTGLGVPHAILAVFAAAYGLYYWRERRES